MQPMTKNNSDKMSSDHEGTTTVLTNFNDPHLCPDETNQGHSEDENKSTSSYVDPSSNDLTLWPGAALIVADCMGTGILALPHDMKVLGAFGLFFLVINLPINFYAGDILHQAASWVEDRLRLHGHTEDEGTCIVEDIHIADSEPKETLPTSRDESDLDNEDEYDIPIHTETTPIIRQVTGHGDKHMHRHYGIDSPHTFDFIGITYAIFDHFGQRPLERTNTNSYLSKTTILVTSIYYVNISLVLGNYILVMSHAVAAMVGEENICLPKAGIIASTLMFAISQLRTMAMLGRSASVISLLSLAIVVVQCLEAIQMGRESFSYRDDSGRKSNESNGWASLMSQLAALSSIGFAVGSQKLFLNIRHEFKDRNDSPKSLAIALASFGMVYVLVCVLAGPDPPSLLFDTIGRGVQRRIAGFFLWVHIAISFAINSQAICSSLDRLRFHRIAAFGLKDKHKVRWAVLTFLVSSSSYFVANAVPFFKDLVALTGALTSVPLTLLLPALYHRKVSGFPLFCIGSCTGSDVLSFLLVAFSMIFLICGIIGSLMSIRMDWANHGPPFACH